MIMEGDPFVLIEGMAIAGIAIGATKGFVYIRSEYPHAVADDAQGDRDRPRGRRARRQGAGLAQRLRHGDPRRRRRLCLRRGDVAARTASKASAAWCAPSRRCRRIKGLFGKPTVINNVISLASVPIILDKGAAYYKDFGMGRSRGTIPIQIAGNVKYGGLFETAFGLTLGEIVDEIGGGTATGRPVKAVQVGGPLGAYFPRALFDTPFDYEAFAAKDGLIGHAGIVGVRRHRRHAEAGALRHGILRHRKLRQVHALPHRLDARRRDDRQDRRRASSRRRTSSW